MSLDKDTLRDLIFEKIEDRFGEVPDKSVGTVKDFAEAIADAVITHIKAAAEVKIDDSDGGLQRDPTTDAYTKAPHADEAKTLNIT